MKIEIKNNKGIEIKSIDQWPKPMRSDQWKDGKSAMLLAEYVLNAQESFCELIASVLKGCNIELQDFKCEPEASKGLGDRFGRGNRHHDLLMIGENCVIGIEAKVSESFDKDSIGKKLEEKKKTKRERAEKLIEFLIPEDKRTDKEYLNLPYQLFTATRSTISCAEKNNIPNSIFLVIVFTGDVLREKDYDEKCRKNEEAFESFREFINADKTGQVLRLGDFWIKKVDIEVSKTFKMACATNIR